MRFGNTLSLLVSILLHGLLIVVFIGLPKPKKKSEFDRVIPVNMVTLNIKAPPLPEPERPESQPQPHVTSAPHASSQAVREKPQPVKNPLPVVTKKKKILKQKALKPEKKKKVTSSKTVTSQKKVTSSKKVAPPKKVVSSKKIPKKKVLQKTLDDVLNESHAKALKKKTDIPLKANNQKLTYQNLSEGQKQEERLKLVQAIKSQLVSFWNMGSQQVREAEGVVVTVLLCLNQDGYIQSARTLNNESTTQHPDFKQVEKSVYRIFDNPEAQPLHLPKETYEEWKETKVYFSPSD